MYCLVVLEIALLLSIRHAGLLIRADYGKVVGFTISVATPLDASKALF